MVAVLVLSPLFILLLSKLAESGIVILVCLVGWLVGCFRGRCTVFTAWTNCSTLAATVSKHIPYVFELRTSSRARGGG